MLLVQTLGCGAQMTAAAPKPHLDLLPHTLDLPCHTPGHTWTYLVTHLAGKGPLIAVDPLMFLQIWSSDERLPTDFTAIGFEPGVDLQVFWKKTGKSGSGQVYHRCVYTVSTWVFTSVSITGVFIMCVMQVCLSQVYHRCVCHR